MLIFARFLACTRNFAPSYPINVLPPTPPVLPPLGLFLLFQSPNANNARTFISNVHAPSPSRPVPVLSLPCEDFLSAQHTLTLPASYSPATLLLPPGLFLSFQSPIEVPGVSNVDFLRMACNARRKVLGQPELDPLEFYAHVMPKVKCGGAWGLDQGGPARARPFQVLRPCHAQGKVRRGVGCGLGQAS